MDSRNALLQQLTIDRTETQPSASSPTRHWWIRGAGAAVAGLAAFAWLSWATPDAVVVGVAIADAVDKPTGVQRASLLDASGYVVARRQATVSSKVTGRVIEILIEEGQEVERDQIVARLDDTNARTEVEHATAQRDQAIATLNAARVAFENERPIFERNQRQFASGVISAQDFDAAKANYDAARVNVEVVRNALAVAEANLAIAQRNLDDMIVRAPFKGVVTVKAAQEGEIVSPISAGGGFTRTGIGTIVDMDSLEVEVDVSENYINRVRPDQSVSIKLNAYPDRDIVGHVIAIIPTADRAKATMRVRIGFDVRDERILPEMGLRVSFLDDAWETSAAQSTAGVIIPDDAVRADGDTGVVFVLRNDHVEERVVRLGPPTHAGRVVLSGIAAGTRLAAGDLSALFDGARVEITE